MSEEGSPWKTISDNLIFNRCWLCEKPFPRGTTKKVFQIGDLLTYFSKRYEAEKALSQENVNFDDPLVVELQSPNLKSCYQRYKESILPDNNISQILSELKANDLEPWFSGLICGLHDLCKKELNYFIIQKSSNSSSKNSGLNALSDKNCPPGCGCDNPWPFLA